MKLFVIMNLQIFAASRVARPAFDLQHFAETIANLNYAAQSKNAGTGAVETEGIEGLTAEMKMFYDKTLLELVGPALIHDQVATKRDIPENSGESIEFRRFNDLSSSVADAVLKDNVTPDGQEMSLETITAVLVQYGRYVKIGTRFSRTAIDPIIVQATKKIAEQASMISDKITRSALAQTTNVIRSGGKAADSALQATDVLSITDIFKAAASLRADNAPTFGGDYIALIHPYVVMDFMTEAIASGGWIDVMKYQKTDNILNGELGKIGGVRFVQSSNCLIEKVSGNTATSVFTTFVCGADGVATTGLGGGGIEHIVKNAQTIGGALNQFSTVGWKMNKVSEILNDDYIVAVRSGSKNFPAAAAN